MSFDKIKAMRNAERFLAQGKIPAAIGEYKRVVESDPKDFSTLNMLGDLHAKASEPQEAVKCFSQVAEYYGNQGFSQKAIAIYNKISRLSPESPEISAKLAELYQLKGSVAEARSHYTALAEQYQRKGNKIEALGVFKQIAQLDPNNTDICLKIADAYLQENQPDEAAAAFIEGGLRLSAKKQYEAAVHAFSKGLEIKPNDLDGLKGIVKAQINLGYTDEAAKTLEKVLEREPYNREVIFLLIDCYLDTNNPPDAERIVLQLVEREAANYPKILDVVRSYLKTGDLDSAARLVSVTSEPLLVGGQAEELEKWVNEILSRNPEHLEGLRLLVRFHGWQRDETGLKDSLERLAEAGRISDSVEDERYALTQLVMMSPHEAAFAERLQEINQLHGYAEVPLDFQPLVQESIEEIPTFESFAVSDGDAGFNIASDTVAVDYTNFSPDAVFGGYSSNEANEYQFADVTFASPVIEDYSALAEPPTRAAKTEAARYEEAHLQQELEGIEFYITQGYTDLAAKSLDALESEIGSRPEIEKYRRRINADAPALAADAPIFTADAPTFAAEIASFANEEFAPPAPLRETAAAPKSFDILDDFRAELGLEEAEDAGEQNDYETHYHLGIAYKEMGLMEEAIRELQDAVKVVAPNDGTRRFLLCCNLLGHCFMEKQMPNLALMWYKRCLETASLDAEERQALRYEVANAYEAGGEREKAIDYFEEIYVENVDYRDVGERLEFLQAQ